MKILFTGGGTLGSVIPLLAIANNLYKRDQDINFFWIGTSQGIEREFVEKKGISFKSVSSGKLRRYFSLTNLLSPFQILLGLVQALFILIKQKPDAIVAAGGFVSVPVIIAGWILRIPSLIHQQDVIPSLSNKLTAPFAKKITVTLPLSKNNFSEQKVALTGNAIRSFPHITKERILIKMGFKSELPTLAVLGGGTGALKINQLVKDSLPELKKIVQTIHITGKGKNGDMPKANDRYINFENYHAMEDLYEAADVVITRAGMGTLSELAKFKKPTIIIPMPDSHQEANANYIKDNRAAIVLAQQDVDFQLLLENINKVLSDKQNQLGENLSKAIPEGTDKIANEVLNLIKKYGK